MISHQSKKNRNIATPAQTLSALESELQSLKQKEKYYLKLAHKVKDLEQKQKILNDQTQMIKDEEEENEQICKLKAEIDGTCADIKKIQTEYQVIKQQVKTSENQLRLLEEALLTFRNQNKIKRQQLQHQDQDLLTKEKLLETFTREKAQFQQKVIQIRREIERLQFQEETEKNLLQNLILKKENQQRQKQKLRSVIHELRKQMQMQKYEEKRHNEKIENLQTLNEELKQEMLVLLKLEQSLKCILQQKTQTYLTITTSSSQSNERIKLLEDQISIAGEDLQQLQREYRDQCISLERDEQENLRHNLELDQISKEALEVWANVKAMLHNQWAPPNVSLDQGKVYKIWMEISSLIFLKGS